MWHVKFFLLGNFRLTWKTYPVSHDNFLYFSQFFHVTQPGVFVTGKKSTKLHVSQERHFVTGKESGKNTRLSCATGSIFGNRRICSHDTFFMWVENCPRDRMKKVEPSSIWICVWNNLLMRAWTNQKGRTKPNRTL